MLPKLTNGKIVMGICLPFRIETDDDELAIFSFLGRVRDRLLYVVRDPKERHVPPVMDWVLKQCDLNKDVEINDKAQVTLPDIQLKTAARVFRIYVKSLKDRAVCRAEESLKQDLVLPEALDNILHPYRSLENKLLNIDQQIKELKYSLYNGTAQSAASRRL